MSIEHPNSTPYAEHFYKILVGTQGSHSGIVFIHGWGCQASDFEAVLHELSKDITNYRLVAINLPGHGKTSTELCPSPTISDFADILLRVCSDLGLSDAILVGHSMGVRIATEAALSSSKNSTSPTIKALIFIDGSNYMLKTTPVSNMASMSPEDRLAAKDRIFQQMFSQRTPESFKASTTAHVAEMDKAHSESLMKDMMRWDREEMESAFVKVGQMRLPLLNLQSSEPMGMDRVPMQEGQMSRYMRWVEEKILEGYRLTVEGKEVLTTPYLKQIAVGGSAHFPHVDRPDFVAEKIQEFVKGIVAR